MSVEIGVGSGYAVFARDELSKRDDDDDDDDA